MVTIGVDQLLSNSALDEHIFLENNKKLYKPAGKCYDQQQCKAINESIMVSNPEVFNDNSPMSPGPYMTIKNIIAKTLLCQFTEVLDVRNRLTSPG